MRCQSTMEWYLIKQNEHLGPFSKKAILDFYKSKEIDEQTFVWKEGWEKAKTYHDIFLKENLLSVEESELPPDLPPLPPDAVVLTPKVKTKVIRKKIAREEKIVSNSKASPIDTPIKLQEGVDSPINVVEQVLQETGNETGNERLIKGVKLTGLSLLIIMILIPSFLYYQSQNSSFSRPKLMTMRDFKKLQRTARKDQSELKFSFALSKDKNSIWISTNNPYRGEVYVSMKSIENRVLGDPVDFSATGSMENNLITLNQFQFNSGSRFADGLYNVEISTAEKLVIPIEHQLFVSMESEFKYIDRAVVTSLSIKDFKKQLGKYLKMKKSNTSEFWVEITEKYKTVKMITGQIRDGFVDIFKENDMSWSQKVTEFENKYKSNWGQFFTAFVKANELSYQKYVSEKIENPQKVLAIYNNLSKLAIMIGEESMSSLEGVQAYDPKKNSEEAKEKLRLQSIAKLDEIINKCEEKIQEIKKQ